MPKEQFPTQKQNEKKDFSYKATPEELEGAFPAAPGDEEEFLEVLGEIEKEIGPDEKEEIYNEIYTSKGGKVPAVAEEPPSEAFRGMPKSLKEVKRRAFWFGLQAEANREGSTVSSWDLLTRINTTTDIEEKVMLKVMARKLESRGR